ncbi:pH regulation protein F [Candidatus Hepatincolaceae symbiont of Richtersius coronifer]
MLLIAIGVIGVLSGFLVFLFIKRKTLPLKIQLVNCLNSLIIILIALYAYYINKPEYIDIALLYAVLNYISIVAISKYLQHNFLKK